MCRGVLGYQFGLSLRERKRNRQTDVPIFRKEDRKMAKQSEKDKCVWEFLDTQSMCPIGVVRQTKTEK